MSCSFCSQYNFVCRMCTGSIFHKTSCAIYTCEPAIFPYERRARGRKRKYGNSHGKYELAPGDALSSGSGDGQRNGGRTVAGHYFSNGPKKNSRKKRRNRGRKEGRKQRRAFSSSLFPTLAAPPNPSLRHSRRRSALNPEL